MSKESKEVSADESMEKLDQSSVPMHPLPSGLSHDINKALYQVIDLNENNILHEPTCIICSSPYREEVEKEWTKDTKHQHKAVQEIFQNKANISVSNDVIDNHMRYHYERGIKELQKVEYADKIKRLNSIDLTTLDRIRLGFSALTERLMNINSITPSGEKDAAEIEKIKSVETARLMGSFEKLLKLQASIMGEMKSSGDLVTIPRSSFVDIFNQALVDAKTNGEKQVVKKILSELASLSKNTQ